MYERNILVLLIGYALGKCGVYKVYKYLVHALVRRYPLEEILSRLPCPMPPPPPNPPIPTRVERVPRKEQTKTQNITSES